VETAETTIVIRLIVFWWLQPPYQAVKSADIRGKSRATSETFMVIECDDEYVLAVSTSSLFSVDFHLLAGHRSFKVEHRLRKK
jgi:hypothetical protein